MTAADDYPVLAKLAERGHATIAGQELLRALNEIDDLRAICDRIVEVDE